MPVAAFPENQPLLDALDELHLLLAHQRIRFWLRGGWALDFLLGRETRPHADLDVVIWHRHAGKIRPLFEKAGYTFKDRGFRAQMDFYKGEAKVSVAFIQRQNNGDITPYQVPDWPWHPDLLGSPRTLYGLRCRTLTP